jgi:hypothetical protein
MGSRLVVREMLYRATGWTCQGGQMSIWGLLLTVACISLFILVVVAVADSYEPDKPAKGGEKWITTNTLGFV